MRRRNEGWGMFGFGLVAFVGGIIIDNYFLGAIGVALVFLGFYWMTD